jgi:hypothetical protein
MLGYDEQDMMEAGNLFRILMGTHVRKLSLERLRHIQMRDHCPKIDCGKMYYSAVG